MTTPLPVDHYDLGGGGGHGFTTSQTSTLRWCDWRSSPAPGGSLVIVGCARSSTIGDYATDAVGAV